MAARLAEPAAVGLDPFPAGGCRVWEREFENRYLLSVSVASADRDDVIVGCDVDAGHGDGHAEHVGVKRHVEMLLEQCEQAGDLF